MNIYEMYARNTEAEKEGVWFSIKGGFKFKMKRQGGDNSDYFKVMQDLTKDIDVESISPEESHKIYMEAFLGTILVDWDGITDKDGNKMPYSKENAEKLFTDLPELFDIVRQKAKDRSDFTKAKQDSIVKN